MTLRNRFDRMLSLGGGPAIAADRALPLAGMELISSREELGKIILVFLQVSLAVLVIEQYQLVSRAFLQIAVLALGGFVVNALLPVRLRLPFFALLSLAGIAVVFGPGSTVWLVGVSLGLIAICHLPISYAKRVGILLASGGLLALMRADWIAAPWSVVIWPILGSMFMFRLIIYMYDLRHTKEPPNFWRTLSYFFMLPNITFALFPVIDHATFKRTYYDGDAPEIYQVGVQWIARGIVQLLLYRVVYYYCMLDPAEVSGWLDLGRYMVANMALYLQVSGVFHLVIGILRLFGFGLPETHFLYFLSSSINDFWRRINIYWKDFMLKVFYQPMFFKLRRSGVPRAIIVSTLVVLVATWFLHSYQWFWIAGSFPVKWQDGAFWGVLGVLMILNSLYENRHSRARGRRARTWSLKSSLGEGLRVAGVFTFICALWSMWTSESLDEWLGMFAFIGQASTSAAGSQASDWLRFGLALAVVPALFGRGREKSGGLRRGPNFRRMAVMTGGGLIGLYLIGNPVVYANLNEPTSDAITSLRVAKLNRIDAAALQRGYYEDLLSVERFNSQLWKLYANRPLSWLPLRETSASRPRADFLIHELVPDRDIQFKGAPLQTNRWAMRDRDYEKTPADGVRRLAIVGASYVMGAGVTNDETFEARLEERLNADGLGDVPGSFEVLNFATAGYSPLQRMLAVEQKVFEFQPDAVLYFAHESELFSLIQNLDQGLQRGHVPPEPLADFFREAGFGPDTTRDALERELHPRVQELLALVYERIASECRSRGILPIWIYLPTLETLGQDRDPLDFASVARAAGFEVVSLAGVYDGHNVLEMRIADWDHHPNADGHQIIADRLYTELSARSHQISQRAHTDAAEVERRQIP